MKKWEIKVASFEADTWDLIRDGKIILTLHENEFKKIHDVLDIWYV